MDHDEEARQKEKQNLIKKEIKDDFESEYLFEDRLMVYGERAKQKLVDFTDYLNLYSCKDLDTLFKQQVRDMIYRLFYDKEAVVQLSVVPGNGTGHTQKNLTELLNSIEKSTYREIEFRITDLKIVEPLSLESIDRYTGKIGCGFRISGITEKDTTLLYEEAKRVKIITTRTSKQFGADTALLIWQVFLDEVDAIN
jgi:hypothetical protein